MYEYKAKLIKVIDGDTVDLDVDLGMDVHINTRIRLAGINTPELHSKDEAEREAAKRAKSALEGLMVNPMVMTTQKDEKEKYGRYLATITNGNGVNVNEYMVKLGHAKKYDGGAR